MCFDEVRLKTGADGCVGKVSFHCKELSLSTVLGVI